MMYQVISADSTFCPGCNKPLQLLTDEKEQHPKFYICHPCAYVEQVGAGNVTSTIKDNMYLSIITSLGEDPSPRELKDAFDLMNYTSEERSEIIFLYEKVVKQYHSEIRGLIPLGQQTLFKPIALLLMVLIISALFAVHYFFVIDIAYTLLVGILIFGVILYRFPNCRPVSSKSIWKRAIQKVVSKKVAQ